MRATIVTCLICWAFFQTKTSSLQAQAVSDFDGKWREVARTTDGVVKKTDLALLEVAEGKFKVSDNAGKTLESGIIEVKNDVTPHLYTVHIEVAKKTANYFGVYKKEGDLLITCVNTVAESATPDTFESKEGSKLQRIVWKRVHASELDGAWKLVGYSVSGVDDYEIVAQDYILVRRDGLQSITKGGEPFSSNLFVTHSMKTPKEIDFYDSKSGTAEKISVPGIYRLDGKELRLAIDKDENSGLRPKDFEPVGKIIARYERIKE